jgi:hypothetical protein
VIPSDGERAVLYNEPDELHGLVNETLAEALVFLRAQAVSGEGKWDPTGDSRCSPPPSSGPACSGSRPSTGGGAGCNSARERRIVALRMGGQSYAEIAVIVGAPSARAVEAVVTRYRKRLHDRGEGDPR